MNSQEFKKLQEKIDNIALKEDIFDDQKHDQLNNIFLSIDSLKADVDELADLDNEDSASGSADLHDQIVTMDKLIQQFYQVIDRATAIVPGGPGQNENEHLA